MCVCFSAIIALIIINSIIFLIIF